jgi:microcompartment protein CcmK/EutM
MITGRVIGDIHSTINHPFYDGKKLLVVEKTDETGKATGDYVIAIDVVDAGVGEPVLVINEGNSARQVFDAENAPVRCAIVGIIDEVSAEENG